MTITHESMMTLTAEMPMKTIQINGENYLQRYFAHQLADGTQVWYHRFLRNDSERHLHSHPWEAKSTILAGWYIEQYRIGDKDFTTSRIQGEWHLIHPGTLHRIIEVQPNTWTMMLVAPEREPTWHFVEDDASRTEMETSPFEWSKDFKARDAA